MPATLALLAVLNLSVPYFALAPGPAEDVNRLLTISGTPTYPSEGRLYLTTVSLRSVTVADAVLGLADPVVALVRREVIIPPESSQRDQDQRNAQQMSDSKIAAAVAALEFLQIPGVRFSGEGARVERVYEDTPAADALREGDVIVGVDGQPVGTTAELTTIIQRRDPGTSFRLVVQREDQRIEMPIRTIAAPDETGRPIIGVQVITLGERVDFPFEIDIRSGGIGGPSAGLMFALGIIELLGPDELTNGHHVAGTGVIDLDGRVGMVGGVVQKVAAAERAGAEVFLVPKREYEDARRASKQIQVIGVDTLREAVEALRALQRPVNAAGGRSGR